MRYVAVTISEQFIILNGLKKLFEDIFVEAFLPCR